MGQMAVEISSSGTLPLAHKRLLGTLQEIPRSCAQACHRICSAKLVYWGIRP
jgi:hypothetical protein